MKKVLNTFVELALEFGTPILLAFISILKTILKWSLFVCSAFSVLGITFIWIFNETYNEPFSIIAATTITIIYTVYMFIQLKSSVPLFTKESSFFELIGSVEGPPDMAENHNHYLKRDK